MILTILSLLSPYWQETLLLHISGIFTEALLDAPVLFPLSPKSNFIKIKSPIENCNKNERVNRMSSWDYAANKYPDLTRKQNMHWYLCLYRKPHRTASTQHIKIHFLLTQNLCLQQVAITDIYQILLLTTPLPLQVCRQSLLANLLTCLKEWAWAKVCFTYIVELVPWQGTEENNTWQAGEKGFPPLCKKCWPKQLFLHLSSFRWPSEETTTLPLPTMVPTNTILSSLSALPSPITPNNKLILAQHPEKET